MNIVFFLPCRLHDQHKLLGMTLESSVFQTNLQHIADNTWRGRQRPVLPCRYCGRTFHSICGQREHERIHTGHTFDCDKCTLRFTTASKLQRHKVAHLSPADRPRFECSFCHKTFSRPDVMKSHQRYCRASQTTSS